MVHNWGYVKQGPTIVAFREVLFASNAEIKHSLLPEITPFSDFRRV